MLSMGNRLDERVWPVHLERCLITVVTQSTRRYVLVTFRRVVRYLTTARGRARRSCSRVKQIMVDSRVSSSIPLQLLRLDASSKNTYMLILQMGGIPHWNVILVSILWTGRRDFDDLRHIPNHRYPSNGPIVLETTHRRPHPRRFRHQRCSMGR